MTKKHYEAIAAILDYYGPESPDTITSIAIDLAEQFEQDNKNFNRTMFLTSCGIDQS